MDTIKAKCKKCGKDTKVSDFVIDNVLKMAVCINCSNQRKRETYKNVNLNKQNYEEEIESPVDIINKKAKQNERAGWDKIDERLVELNIQKRQSLPKVKRISNEKVKYKCSSCKYEFPYNFVKEIPKSCPFCDQKTEKIKIVE